MKQETFTDMEYNSRKKKTKMEEFLEVLEEIIPWKEWVGIIASCYPVYFKTSLQSDLNTVNIYTEN